MGRIPVHTASSGGWQDAGPGDVGWGLPPLLARRASAQISSQQASWRRSQPVSESERRRPGGKPESFCNQILEVTTSHHFDCFVFLRNNPLGPVHASWKRCDDQKMG